jgi:predicted metal-dependent hydrolase
VNQGSGEAPGRVIQGGRAKAYRPIPEADRRRAIAAGLRAYRKGDFFEAHELLEPAWMGTLDLAERDLLQGLIKLAAGYVHAVRGNPAGVARNLVGARERLERSGTGRNRLRLDVAALVAAIDDRLDRLRTFGDGRAEPAAILDAVPPPALEVRR